MFWKPHAFPHPTHIAQPAGALDRGSRSTWARVAPHRRPASANSTGGSLFAAASEPTLPDPLSERRQLQRANEQLARHIQDPLLGIVVFPCTLTLPILSQIMLSSASPGTPSGEDCHIIISVCLQQLLFLGNMCLRHILMGSTW